MTMPCPDGEVRGAPGVGDVHGVGAELILERDGVRVVPEDADELHRARARGETRGGDRLVRAFASHGGRHGGVRRQDRLVEMRRTIDADGEIHVERSDNHDGDAAAAQDPSAPKATGASAARSATANASTAKRDARPIARAWRYARGRTRLGEENTTAGDIQKIAQLSRAPFPLPRRRSRPHLLAYAPSRLSNACITIPSHPSIPGLSGKSTPGRLTASHAFADVPPMHAYSGCRRRLPPIP